MRGAHRIIVEAKRIKYDFVIRRNITIFTGDSGSGKTVLIDLIRDYRRYGNDSGVSVSCDCDCRTLDHEDWEQELAGISGSIIFIDEGNRFLTSKRFAELVQGADNYFVLATRERLPMLPYSIQEIYGFRKSGRFISARQSYNEIFHLYGEISQNSPFRPMTIITEDSNSGFAFFESLAQRAGLDCISANGKSNILQKLSERKNAGDNILIVVDGAAFGSEMKDVYEYLETEKNVVLYAPESFEWLLLSSGGIPNVNAEKILEQPEEYIDSIQYISWERYFTQLLIQQTRDDPVWAYSKKKLPSAYLSFKIIRAVKERMKLITLD